MNISGVFNFLSFTVTDIWKLIYYTIFTEHQVDVKRQCHSSPISLQIFSCHNVEKSG